jgi:predicted anti-sigma-YlaC factor YlaD
MKNQCVEREKIFALAQDMLSGREQQETRAHVESCQSCRNVFQSYHRLDAVLDEWSPAAEASPWFDARLRAALAAQAERPSGFLGLSWSRWMAAPALASLLVVASIVMLRQGRFLNHPQSGATTKVAVVTAPAAPPAPTKTQVTNDELKMYQNLPVLEDYDMLADFDVISELPKGTHKIAD